MDSWNFRTRSPTIAPGPLIQQLQALAIKEITSPQITVQVNAAEVLDDEHIDDDHISDYRVLEKDLQCTAKRVLKNLEEGKKYDKVLVLGVYWHKSVGKPDHIAGHAEELLAVFRDKYRYEVKTLELLDEVDGYTELNGLLHDIGKKLGSKQNENLFILYYGGHGGLDHRTGQARHWLPDMKDAAEGIDWYHLQQQLGKFYFDILFIFDCCYAMAMPDRHIAWRKRCEIVGAAGEREKAGGKPEISFTNALTAHLQEDFETIGETNIWRVVSEMQSRDYKRTLKSTPQHRVLAQGYASTIPLVPLCPDERNPSSGSSSSSSRTLAETLKSDARILIGIKTTNIPKAAEFEKMLSFLPPSVTDIEVGVYSQKLLDFLGLFESNSGLALILAPVWFWCAMDRNPAYRYIDVVRSGNLLQGYRAMAPQVASPTYCTRGVQTKNLGEIASKDFAGGEEERYQVWRNSFLSDFPRNTEKGKNTAPRPLPHDSVASRPSSISSRRSSVFSERSSFFSRPSSIFYSRPSSIFSSHSHRTEPLIVGEWQTTIFFLDPSNESNALYPAAGVFNSKSEFAMISSTYAKSKFGFNFNTSVRTILGTADNGDSIDSIGELQASWAFSQDVSSSSSSGNKITPEAKIQCTTFFVVDHDHFDVIFGHSSLERAILYEGKPKSPVRFRQPAVRPDAVSNPISWPSKELERLRAGYERASIAVTRYIPASRRSYERWQGIGDVAYEVGNSELVKRGVILLDSQSKYDLISTRFASKFLLDFSGATREPYAVTITGDEVYSVGTMNARWYTEKSRSRLPFKSSGPTMWRFIKSEFLVIESDIFDVIIGELTINEHKLFEGQSLLAPFRGSTSRKSEEQESIARQRREQAAKRREQHENERRHQYENTDHPKQM